MAVKIPISILISLIWAKNHFLIPRHFAVVAQEIFRSSTVNTSTTVFPYINLAKTMTNLLAVWKITEKGWNNLCLLPKVFHRSSKSNSYLMSISRRGPVNLPIPIFGNISFTEAMKNLLFTKKFNQKWLQ